MTLPTALSPIRIDPLPLPRVGPLQVAARLVTWTTAVARLAVERAVDHLRGRDDPALLGQRVRELFERVGGTALKVGQQLSVRADLLPWEVCHALEDLLDAVPPIPPAEARRVVESSLGRPLDEVFESFGHTLLGSASIAVVYGARLRSGERVAVKVRRPGVAERILADLQVLELLTRLAELFTVVRPGHFRHLREDLRSMLCDELDLRKEADHQVRFRDLVRRDGLPWLDAPRVFMRWTTEAVLVSEWIEGTGCGAVIDAVDRRDEVRLAELAAQGIHPDRLARRIMELSQYSRLECPFFQADPHPGNLIVLPDDRLVVLDFGSVGTTSSDLREQMVELNRRLLDEDFHGAAAMSVAMLSPLPFLDVDELRYRLEHALWRAHMPSLIAGSAWWERTSMGLWLSILEVTRELQLPANVDVLRGVRANLLYDTLAHRLDPGLEKRKVIRRWYKRSGERLRRRVGHELQRRGERAISRDWEVWAAEMAEIGEKGRYTLARLARNTPAGFRALSDAMGYAMAQLLHLLLAGLVLFSAGLCAAAALRWWGGDVVSLGPLARDALMHPVAWMIGVVMLWVWYRRVLYRLRARESVRA